MIGLQASSWETDIKHTLNHEWAQVPTAMFTDTGELRKGKTKSVLKNQLKIEVSERHIESQITC